MYIILINIYMYLHIYLHVSCLVRPEPQFVENDYKQGTPYLNKFTSIQYPLNNNNKQLTARGDKAISKFI